LVWRWPVRAFNDGVTVDDALWARPPRCECERYRAALTLYRRADALLIALVGVLALVVIVLG